MFLEKKGLCLHKSGISRKVEASLPESHNVGTCKPKSVTCGDCFFSFGSPRSDKTQVLNSYQYEDEDDLFAREPFVAQFTLPSKSRRGRTVGSLDGSTGGLVTWRKLGEKGWGWMTALASWALQSFPVWCWSRCTPLLRM